MAPLGVVEGMEGVAELFGACRLGVLVGVGLERLPDPGMVVGVVGEAHDVVVAGGHVGPEGLPFDRLAGEFFAGPVDRGQSQPEPSRTMVHDVGGDTSGVTVAVPR
jgi:hypothetical protein